MPSPQTLVRFPNPLWSQLENLTPQPPSSLNFSHIPSSILRRHFSLQSMKIICIEKDRWIISRALLHKACFIHFLVRSHLSHVDPDDGGRLVLASQLLKSCSKAGQGGLPTSINLSGVQSINRNLRQHLMLFNKLKCVTIGIKHQESWQTTQMCV